LGKRYLSRAVVYLGFKKKEVYLKEEVTKGKRVWRVPRGREIIAHGKGKLEKTNKTSTEAMCAGQRVRRELALRLGN